MSIFKTLGTRRGIRKKLSMATLIQLSIVFFGVFMFLPFLDVRLDQDIIQIQNMGLKLKDKEVATIAKFISFEFGRMEELNQIKLDYFKLQEEKIPHLQVNVREQAIWESLIDVQSFLWEQCTFNPEVIYVDLVALFRGRILNVTPFVGQTKYLEKLSQLDSTVFPDSGKERYGDVSRLILLREFIGQKPLTGRQRLFNAPDKEFYLMPLYVSGSYWGVVRMVISTKDINRQINKSINDKKIFKFWSSTIFVGIMILGYIAGLFIMNFLGSQLIEPIQKLTNCVATFDKTQDTKAIAAIEVDKDDEVGVLKQTFLDLTTRIKESEKQLQQSAKMATLGEMGATVAHEINNRLGLGSLAAQELMMFLHDKETVEKQKVVKTMNKIIRSFERCSAFATKFKNFARPQKEALGPLDLNEVVDEVQELIKKRLERAGVQLDLQLEEIPKIWGNLNELEQVFINMVFNAQDAIALTLNENKQFGTVRIRTYPEEDNVVLEIGDDGIGMDEETKGKLFTPFFTTKELKGTGLGLSICDGILKLHNAKITIESQPGKGTTFIIKFPIYTGE